MSKLTKKVLALLLLTGGLSILLGLLDSLSHERALRKEAVVAEIAQSSAGAQEISGPVLIEEVEVTNGDTKVVETRYRHPRALDVAAQAAVETRHRGIFVVPTFTTTQVIAGAFDPPPATANAVVKSAAIVLHVSDTRGFVRPPTLRFADLDVAAVPGNDPAHQGVQGNVPIAAAARGGSFEIRLELAGTHDVSWAPVAGEAVVHVKSAWPHPSFVGGALPSERHVSANGFEATWRTNPFQNGASLSGTLRDASSSIPGGRSFGVQFASPGDSYAQVDRAVKYGFLFVALTFAAFGIFEATRRLAIHVVQYGMVGVALVLFFLLLLSLAEHVSFAWAYATGTTACIALLVFYLRHVLGGWRRSAGFGAMFVGLYGTLYVLLQLEEYALVVGSGVLFALLTTAMIVTRRVDWYRIGEVPAPPTDNNPYRAWANPGGHFGGGG